MSSNLNIFQNSEMFENAFTLWNKRDAKIHKFVRFRIYFIAIEDHLSGFHQHKSKDRLERC